ncbi:MAG: hypothetical protein ACRYG8_23795 [Janthinobacterium lividum]
MICLQTLETILPAMLARASVLDAAGAFPAEDVAALRQAGVLSAPVPVAFGGDGVGTEPVGAEAVLALMLALGRGNLAVARLIEAHVNALRLIVLFGDKRAVEAAVADARAGHLFGLWVTDGRRALVADGERLSGQKGPCSGAGHCTRALVTAEAGDGVRMAVVALSGAEAVVPVQGMQGMRGAANGVVDLDGATVRDWVGIAGDYLMEPDFSCGAWRASAAAAGALAGLVEAVGEGLRRKGQTEAPMQLARFGEMVTARETARLWVERMAEVAEGNEASEAEKVATVNLGRGAVERACLDGIRLAQRSMGLGAFVAPNPVERMVRDLGIYLRQPAPDAVLLEAAAWHLAR